MKKLRTYELHGVAAELMRFVHKDDPTPNSPRWPDGHPRELKWFGREAEERATPAAKRKWSENAQRSCIAFFVEQKFRQNQHLAALLLATTTCGLRKRVKTKSGPLDTTKTTHSCATTHQKMAHLGEIGWSHPHELEDENVQ
ncbi:hypothetical protein niasHS_016344 [Heterodera schachtii]|uniref:Uncharacterized protein n=1 Tax=Heterodera schachtii TaxID=97005 RepID=A0ABD2HTL3_HETSC